MSRPDDSWNGLDGSRRVAARFGWCAPRARVAAALGRAGVLCMAPDCSRIGLAVCERAAARPNVACRVSAVREISGTKPQQAVAADCLPNADGCPSACTCLVLGRVGGAVAGRLQLSSHGADRHARAARNRGHGRRHAGRGGRTNSNGLASRPRPGHRWTGGTAGCRCGNRAQRAFRNANSQRIAYSYASSDFDASAHQHACPDRHAAAHESSSA